MCHPHRSGRLQYGYGAPVIQDAPSPLLRVPPRPAVVDRYARAHAHVAQRLQERYGLIIGLVEFTRLCLDLADHDLSSLNLLSKPRGLGRVAVLVRVQGVKVPVVWCPKTGVIVTVYERGMRLSEPGEQQRYRREQAQRIRRKRNPYKRRPKHRGQE